MKQPAPQKPNVTVNGKPFDGHRFTHPAFGKITVTKPQGGNLELFGSDLKHNHYISVLIEDAHLDRHLNRDWIHGDNTIVEFCMSEAQWASFVSSVGISEGTPITFDVRPEIGTRIMRCPAILSHETTRETFDREIRETTQEYVTRAKKLVADLAAAVKEGKANKGTLQALHQEAESLANRLPDTVSFVNKQFTERMEGAVSSAKAEIENFAATIAMRTGIAVQQERVAALIDTKPASDTDVIDIAPDKTETDAA